MDFFRDLQQAAPDAILGIFAAFAADTRPHKINLGAGVYRTAELKSYILPSVRRAEQSLFEKALPKDYLPIDGDPQFIRATKQLVFGNELAGERIHGMQTVGGTSALRVAAQFLKNYVSDHIYLSDPTWPNHRHLFTHAGFVVHTYPYYVHQRRGINVEGMLHALEQAPEKSIVLFHGCCHNPTGFDPNEREWGAITALLKKRRLFPFFDLAYQGFGEGLVEDSAIIRQLAATSETFFVATSYSKNFGLYAERVGALFAVCHSAAEAAKVGSQLRVVVRGLYSNPPCHGAQIVAHILEDPELRMEWESELTAMRERIWAMRVSLVKALAPHDFQFLIKQRGMFSYTGLAPEQVARLTKEFAIYLPNDGRINVAGLNAANIPLVAQAIHAVLTHA